MPLSADFRVLQFNITTFDYCKSKNYDLHYPPVTLYIYLSINYFMIFKIVFY